MPAPTPLSETNQQKRLYTQHTSNEDATQYNTAAHSWVTDHTNFHTAT